MKQRSNSFRKWESGGEPDMQHQGDGPDGQQVEVLARANPATGDIEVFFGVHKADGSLIAEEYSSFILPGHAIDNAMSEAIYRANGFAQIKD